MIFVTVGTEKFPFDRLIKIINKAVKKRADKKKSFTLKSGAQITRLKRFIIKIIDFDEEVKLDLFYIEDWSVKLDLIILLKTPFVILFKKHK